MSGCVVSAMLFFNDAGGVVAQRCRQSNLFALQGDPAQWNAILPSSNSDRCFASRGRPYVCRRAAVSVWRSAPHPTSHSVRTSNRSDRPRHLQAGWQHLILTSGSNIFSLEIDISRIVGVSQAIPALSSSRNRLCTRKMPAKGEKGKPSLRSRWRRSDASMRCSIPNAPSTAAAPTSGAPCARNRASRLSRTCTPGCYVSAKRSRVPPGS
ncbi:hypothetical protein ABIE89_009139 [Bradyrhizobium niftali]